ncbi:hypothetical protein ASPTUDRAFT_562564 [Aspergillus tubingensis CBS 134.48]|uniref:Secreted protein n=1 Tax=Aspergillus tubingensis (strain CBS 134.48) TaxID=767770 RepID=A0A1L9N778_ASPTC|nr:hypothetical protein ASPTUDRAFT_562564 [Aspergillus tubingensis CBS 134.48]
MTFFLHSHGAVSALLLLCSVSWEDDVGPEFSKCACSLGNRKSARTHFIGVLAPVPLYGLTPYRGRFGVNDRCRWWPLYLFVYYWSWELLYPLESRLHWFHKAG